MKRYITLLLMSVLTVGGITACKGQGSSDSSEFKKIDGAKAHEMMESSSVTVLDVRTSSEYNAGHINDALLIPYTEIDEKASSMLPDKDATILVYCRSGHRSAIAASSLVSAGYTNVYDFGGIQDWEYETVK